MRLASPRVLGWGCVCLFVVQPVVISPVSAKRTQAQLTATFKDRTVPAGAAAGPALTCTIRFADIRDERRSPEMAGVVGQRGVLAPKDTKAWLEAVLGGLAARGIKPAIGTEAVAEAGVPTASFVLQTAWIASTDVTYSANVVVHMKAQTAAGHVIDQVYRGRVSRTAYWSGGVDTLQSAMDGAFADALDAMAVDLKPLCGS